MHATSAAATVNFTGHGMHAEHAADHTQAESDASGVTCSARGGATAYDLRGPGSNVVHHGEVQHDPTAKERMYHFEVPHDRRTQVSE